MGKQACAVLVWLLITVLLAACGASGDASRIPESRSTPLPPDTAKPSAASAACQGRIAFVGRADGQTKIFVVDADGSELVKITNGADYDRSPAWSPDGACIAFTRHIRGSDIYTIRPDGSELQRLTDWPSREYAPSWSPDGRHVLFGSTSGNASEIFVMSAAGGEAVPLTTGSGAHKPDFIWSPDRSRIAFTMLDGYNQGDIWVIPAPDELEAGSSGAVKLTQHPGHDCCVAWGPDSERLLFLSSRSVQDAGLAPGGRWNDRQSTDQLIRAGQGGALAGPPDDVQLLTTVVPETPEDIYVLHSDGSGLTRLTNGAGKESHASWSPDGKRIAFVSDRDGNDEIYVMDVAAGSKTGDRGITQLTDNPEDYRYPTWSPDGTCLAFVSYHDGRSALYVVNVDSGGLTKLADGVAWDNRPTWSPQLD